RATLALSVDTVAAAISPETVGLGDLWTLGVMRLLGLEFNLANVWALPLIVGTAAEYGLNIYVRYLEGIDGGGPRFPRTVVLGVVLSWLTTMAGFGSLMVAHHHGIFTLGLLLSVGSTASLVAAVFVLPVLIGLFAERSPPSPAAGAPSSAATGRPSRHRRKRAIVDACRASARRSARACPTAPLRTSTRGAAGGCPSTTKRMSRMRSPGSTRSPSRRSRRGSWSGADSSTRRRSFASCRWGFSPASSSPSSDIPPLVAW